MTSTGESVLVLDLLADRLRTLSGWDFTIQGDFVKGPGTIGVTVAAHSEVEVTEQTVHIDVGFVLNPQRADATVWDCASGFGETKALALESAVDAWAQTTGPVLLELLTQEGRFADHYASEDAGGVPGRHALHGAILGWGRGDGLERLQQWWLAHPLLPRLAPYLPIDPDVPFHGVRIFFGSSDQSPTAEVRVNGVEAPRAAAELLSLDWPRFADPAYVRAFVLLLPAA